MVAGDTKKIIVIKNISSNLIEEAILILKSNPGDLENKQYVKMTGSSSSMKNNYILKEAENIINQYIKENGLVKTQVRHSQSSRKIPHMRISVNGMVNIFLIAAIAFLAWVVSKLF